MLFNSYIFLFFFLPVTWFFFRIACSRRATNTALVVLLFASLFFYSYWNPPFILLILFSILFNYAWGRGIERAVLEGGNVKAWLLSGLGVNLALIAYFKYANFFMANLAFLRGSEWLHRDIFLPLGISFFTFQQMAYLVDCSKGLVRGLSFTQYALFVAFFPQLIAGPIVRYDQIIPQFSRLRTFALSYRNIAIGLTLLSLGLFKKLVIADTLSPWAGAVFDSTEIPPLLEAWIGVLCYTFQIYFDFSGYSDMALGLGRLFNIELPVNFASPYKSCSITEFWRRWHISLSTFLRDYLYIPLGGNRKGALRRYGNLMATMLLGGLWHGASWNFVIWGGLHGLYLCANHALTAVAPMREFPRLQRFLGWFVTFFSVVVAWVFFRSHTLGRALELFSGMFGLNDGFSLPESLGIDRLVVLGACFLLVVLVPNSQEWTFTRFREGTFTARWAVAVGVVLLTSVCFLHRVSEFLYFQF